MKKFPGFPSRMDYAPVPAVFFTALLPDISDTAELKVVLNIFRILLQKRGYPRYATFRELASDALLKMSLRTEGPTSTALRGALAAAIGRGVLLHLAVRRQGASEDVYLLNNPQGREALERVKAGEIGLPGLDTRAVPEPAVSPAPNIFTVYEENIGLLTPIVSEQIKEAEKLYPEAWITDAIRESVNANKRSWRYISSLLERWAIEGKHDGTHKRHTKETDPDRFVKGQYGHLFQR